MDELINVSVDMAYHKSANLSAKQCLILTKIDTYHREEGSRRCIKFGFA